MNDMDLPFLVGAEEKFEECGIDVSAARKSKDGTQAIIHLHGLTIEQFNAVRTKTSIEAMSYEQAQELLQTAEWQVE